MLLPKTQSPCSKALPASAPQTSREVARKEHTCAACGLLPWSLIMAPQLGATAPVPCYGVDFFTEVDVVKPR